MIFLTWFSFILVSWRFCVFSRQKFWWFIHQNRTIFDKMAAIFALTFGSGLSNRIIYREMAPIIGENSWSTPKIWKIGVIGLIGHNHAPLVRLAHPHVQNGRNRSLFLGQNLSNNPSAWNRPSFKLIFCWWKQKYFSWHAHTIVRSQIKCKQPTTTKDTLCDIRHAIKHLTYLTKRLKTTKNSLFTGEMAGTLSNLDLFMIGSWG